MDRIIRQLKNNDRVLVASHANPDGDAIGSLIAMGLALDALGKRVSLYNESPIPQVYRFLPSVIQVHRRLDDFGIFDTAFILDCGDLERIGGSAAELRQVGTIVNIDHHITNTGFGDLQLIDSRACATAELVYRLITAMEIPISADMAAAIYTGILTDTGSFRFNNTNREAFAISAQMVAHGVDPFQIAQHLYGTYSLGRIKLLNMALESIEITDNGKLSWMAVTQEMLDETGTRPQDVDGLINYARNIKNVKVAALIQELMAETGKGNGHREFHISLRSDGEVDVAAIAAAYGGGGHFCAAGFSIETTLSDIKGRLLTLADKI